MPFARTFRTDGQTNAPRGYKTYVPYNAVLFYYGRVEDFSGTPSGTLNYDNYREYSDIYYPVASYYDESGTLTTLKSNPLISCVISDNNWGANTGVCRSSSTNLPNTGATLFESYTHNPSTLVRSTIYNALGSVSGDLPASNNGIQPATYRLQFGDDTHDHSASGIADSLRSVVYGEEDYTGTIQGINAIAVNPILRDPLLTTTTTTYNDKKLYFFPKNILVFGDDLPTNNYSRDDSSHIYSANNKILPLIATNNEQGILNLANTLTFSLLSNTVLSHNHESIPVTNRSRSNKTNQKGYRILDAGIHNHKITYTANVALKSKILKAWITTQDETLIANGVIIAYSIGPSTLYPGVYSNSAGLPVNWHFCDGTKGTPDLRGYFIYANFDTSNTYHDVVYNSSNTLVISDITMEANGNHSHLGPLSGEDTGFGTATDIGSHTFEDSLNHTHAISSANTFKLAPSDASNVTNIIVSQSYEYKPPRVDLAFIMYNENIV